MLSPEVHRREKPSDSAAPTAAKTRGYARTLSATSIGLEMALAVALGALFGYWADGTLGSTPWLMLLGLGFGFAAGMKGVFRYMRQLARDEKETA
jgi:ATP synthase protein I